MFHDEKNNMDYQGAKDGYKRSLLYLDADALQLVAGPAGARSTVRKGPRQLHIVFPSVSELLNYSPASRRRILACYAIFFSCIIGVMCFFAIWGPISISGEPGLAAISIPFILIWVLALCCMKRCSHHWSRNAVLEISGDEFRAASLSAPSCFGGKAKLEYPKGEAWRRMTKTPEVTMRTVTSSDRTQSAPVLVLVEGVEPFDFGHGLSSLELEWLLEKINDTIGSV
ncbi:hypothetical protein BSKO_09324 [Bryopsis sp. KO-2023]|nr:hypothetical protein BSKO_09324 [Bryopsis sp. KO-2023]